jgi:hypothetical protein
MRGDVTHPRHRRQPAGAVVDRRQDFSHVGINLEQGRFERSDQSQMQLQQPPVVRSDASMQRFDQLAAFLAGSALGEIGKFLRITSPP